MNYEQITTRDMALKTIESLRRDSLNCNVFSVYDYDCLTIQELLCKFFEKINQCVDVSNKTVVLVEWLVDQGLKSEIAKQLNQWFVDGTLKTIINEVIFNELNEKVNTLRQDFEAEKLSTNNRFDNATRLINNNKKFLRDYYNVVELGADPTGVQDCTEIINTNSVDKKLYFPTGKYKHTGLIIKNSIKGDNANLYYEGVGTGVIVDGNDLVVERIKFTSSKADTNLVQITQKSGIDFVSCEFDGSHKSGIYLDTCEKIHFSGSNSFTKNGKHGLHIKNSKFISMNAISCYENVEYGVWIQGDSTGSSLTNSMICYNVKGGIYVDGSNDSRRFIISNNQILFNKDTSGQQPSYAMYLYAMQNGIVSSNTIVGSKTMGIGIVSSHNMNITSNQIEAIEATNKSIHISAGCSACNVIGNAHSGLTMDIADPKQHTVIDYTGQNFIKGGITVENIVRFGSGNIQNYSNGNMDIICDKPGGTSTMLIGNGNGSQPDTENVNLKVQGKQISMLNTQGRYVTMQMNGFNNLVVNGNDMVNLVDVPAHHTTPGNYGSIAVSDTDLFIRTKNGKWKYVSLKDYHVG